MYTFDKEIDRKNTECEKIDHMPYKNIPESFYPLWVADMDFETAPEIMEALEVRMKHKIFGYFHFSDRYYDSIINWHDRRYDVKGIKASHICYQNGVLAGISHAIDLLTEKGDPILLQSPIYPGFIGVVKNTGRRIVTNPLINNNGYYTMDFKQMESIIIKEKIKVFIFCNPHNPTGRTWTKEEMKTVTSICIKHNVIILSDEIWSDMIIKQGQKHLPLTAADERAKEITISFYSPSKGYNLAGMVSSYSICYNEELCEKLRVHSYRLHCNSPCVLAVETTIAAYDKAEEWLEACISYINENMDFVLEFLNTRLPNIQCRKPDGTYLMWLDFSKTGLSHKEIIHRAVVCAGFIGSDGATFYEGGKLFMRLNPTTTRNNLEQALLCLEQEFKNVGE